MKELKLFIDGEWISGESGTWIEVENPATREIIAKVPRGNEADVNKAVAAARRAFPGWAATPPDKRAAIMRKVGTYLEENKKMVADVITAELGMPVKVASDYHVEGPIYEANYFADVAENFEYIIKQGSSEIHREPVGVVAGLTPWNYPLDQVTLKLFAAVAAGNCVVLKPSQLAPLSGLIVADAFDKAGLPKGVFNVVTGAGAEVGDILAKHEDVDMISFTGSTAAGKEVGKLALGTVKKFALEMGGKSPALVLEGADLDLAVEDVLYSSMMNSGQTCCAFTRFIIPSSLKAEIEEKLKEKIKDFVVGDPLDENSDIGPVISEKAFKKIKGYIELGLEEGATMLTGAVPEGYEKGYYINPVIFTDVKNDMRIAQEEIFGPVLVVIPYETPEEGLQIALDTPYGPDGAVYGPKEAAYEAAKKYQSGCVHINGAAYSADFPFGGYNQSGLGREGGIYGFEEYLEIKSVFMPEE